MYEVSLSFKSSKIRSDALDWLRAGHIDKVLGCKGFIFAELFECRAENTLIVRYTVASNAHLDEYLLVDAPKLRKEGLRLFGDEMVASRRIMRVLDTFNR